MELYTGRPADCGGRLEREVRTYDFLDSLGIEYWRTDHFDMPAMTMEDCNKIDAVLGVLICKNLFLCNRQRRPAQNLLPRTAGCDQSTLPGSFRLKTIILQFFRKPAQQTVLQGSPGILFLPVLLWKSRLFHGNHHTHIGRGSKRISLSMIYRQNKVSEIILSPQIFISRITFSMDPLQFLP